MSLKETVLDFFEDTIEDYKHKIAITDGERNISYEALNKKANGLAKHLKTKGRCQNSIIAVYLEPSIEFIISMLAIIKIGAAYLPLDTETPAIRVKQILQNSNPLKIITNAHLSTNLPQYKDQIIVLNDLVLEETDDAIKLATSSSNDLLCIMYTSGSTGTPKGCMISHRSVINLIKNSDLIPFKENEHIAHISNVAFDASTFEIWGALLNGINLFIFPREKLVSIETFSAFLNDKQIKILFLTTAFFNLIVRTNPECFDNLHYLLFGGEKANPDITNLLLSRKKSCGLDNLNILHVYGPTENTTFSTKFQLETDVHYKQSIPIGKPLTNVKLYILNDTSQAVSTNTIGEIYLAGENLALGYLNNVNQTNENFIQPPEHQKMYKTGDFAYEDEHGFINFVSRKDSQIKIRGYRIELYDIEKTLSNYELIDQVFLDTISHQNELAIIAYIIPLRDKSIQPSDFYHFIHKNLPDYMVPKKIYIVNNFPLNQNGKIDKEKLRRMDLKTIFNVKDAQKPTNKIETIIANLFNDLLNDANISTNNNFFDLGVNSLVVIEACSQLNQKISAPKKIEEIDFYTHPTIELLAKYISENNETNEILNCSHRALLQRQALSRKHNGRK